MRSFQIKVGSDFPVVWVSEEVLDAHDVLIGACVEGRLPFEEFLRRYDNFYDRFALDGHESSPDGRKVLTRQVERIRLHARIRDEILYRLCSEALFPVQGAHEAGFIGAAEGQARLGAIWAEYLRMPH